MNTAAALVLGLLIGWLVEWVVDWFYWRGRIDHVAGENIKLKERVTALEEEIGRKEQEIQRQGEAVKVTALRDKEGNDNLQAIHGIGPVFAKRLNEAGVRTFERLASLTPQDLEEILGTLFKRFYSRENIILAQAKEFAEQKARQG